MNPKFPEVTLNSFIYKEAISHTIVTVEDDHMSNISSNHFFPKWKNLSKKTTAKLCKNVSLIIFTLFLPIASLMQSLCNVYKN